MKFSDSDRIDFLQLLGGETSYNKILLDKVISYQWLFNILPGVREVAICNSVSFGVADENSDIDLFFILKKNRFFIYRFVITVLFSFFSIRRHGDKIAGRFCLSFFIREDYLDLSPLLISNDVYFYFWFYHLIFLKGDKAYQTDFLLSNTWFDAPGFRFRNLDFLQSSSCVKYFERFIELKIFKIFEDFMKFMQLKRIKNKNQKLGSPAGVYFSDQVLKFHVTDIRKQFSEEFYRAISR